MKATLEIVDAGPANQWQDRGRPGHRAIGVPVAGAADPLLLACANRLVGNPPDEAGIEMPLAGPTLRAIDGPVQLALAGAVSARLTNADGQQRNLVAWRSLTLAPGEQLSIGSVRAGVAYLALAGGCDLPAIMGSRSTYARASLGGVQGRALRAGDRFELPARPGRPGLEWQSAAFSHQAGPLRVMAGPQDEAFAPTAWQTLVEADWRVGRDSDRMGLRLEGPTLQHLAGADIASEAVVPGAIQVPGNGAPIVLGVDAQTAGGYTKIATVIRADLGRLAQLRPGDTLRFTAVSRVEALAARQALVRAWERWAAGIVPLQAAEALDSPTLLATNLVSGSIDSLDDKLPWEHAS